MRTVSIVMLIVSILATLFVWVYAAVWGGYVYPKNYAYNLRLADDASLPKVKADYLRAYLKDVSTIKRKPAYVFFRPDMDLETQREILKGLIKRFDDIARISPSEMAYQQGMEQLTGQEIDHQLGRVGGLFYNAKMRENFWIFFTIWYLTWLFPLGVIGAFWIMIESGY